MIEFLVQLGVLVGGIAVLAVAAWSVFALAWCVLPLLLLPGQVIYALFIKPLAWGLDGLAGRAHRALAGPPIAWTGGTSSGLTLGRSCNTGGCRCANPAAARYCRRCGAALAR